jgi:hypothetical protein
MVPKCPRQLKHVDACGKLQRCVRVAERMESEASGTHRFHELFEHIRRTAFGSIAVPTRTGMTAFAIV